MGKKLNKEHQQQKSTELNCEWLVKSCKMLSKLLGTIQKTFFSKYMSCFVYCFYTKTYNLQTFRNSEKVKNGNIKMLNYLHLLFEYFYLFHIHLWFVVNASHVPSNVSWHALHNTIRTYYQSQQFL